MQVLLVEDTDTDVELITRALKRGVPDVGIRVAGTEAEYVSALEARLWDIILSDHNLPGFDSLRALQLLQQRGKDIPFIIVSGAIGEETAVAAMKAGASDYVMKHNLARLAPAVEREIREAAIRRDKRRAEEALRLSEARLTGIIGSAMDAVIAMDHTQRVVLFNAAAESMFGYTQAEMIAQPIELLFPGGQLQSHVVERKRPDGNGQGMGPQVTLQGARRAGKQFPVEATFSRVNVSGERYFTIIARDVSERLRAQERMAASLREKEVLLQEIQHRVKNNLQVVSSLLSLQANRVEHPSAAAALRDSHNRVRAMALVHEKLYTVGDLAQVDFGQYLRDLLPELVRSYQPDPGRISVCIDAPALQLDVNTAIPLALIANELATNSLKHAFPSDRPGEIVVTARPSPLGSGQPLLTVRDNGVGMAAEGATNARSLGVKLVSSLAQQIGCVVRWRSSNGTIAAVVEDV